jgi:hypothetical protein
MKANGSCLDYVTGMNLQKGQTHPQELLLLPILYCLDPGGNDLVDSAGCFVVRAMTN